ncbi:16S rRNA (adenine1518-N6/adenine1519-N6)-dimethyltransferase [Verrucomicrobium sp. GAS474]|uniref:16S rRNA (adenine(1518)-N(6)/adenine(1519)-N(6))- dimethyltransferase RsmA n=1 Tax=Verrucomicrobium sp. GAS474 TaxID=1882831 RepID=UPI00087ACE60|nr:16S rRNA (adenine(1518)-N(6)/adenine(1519)-N(6))-dimethyltransferase RsmA [Verrucomicrobium sp. GAS474]SDT92536.1 16S rRNA (adenine1518-N6/adenine1519-N6)-dimethyltransferase [Verrucomicrobium sp. GAS474]
MTLTEIRRLLDERGMRPLARFGQNFLHDQNLAKAIVLEAIGELYPAGPVLEVGPGLGALTELILDAGLELTALEIDRGLAALLRERLGAKPGFTLVEGDALETLADPAFRESAGGRPRLFLGNLPYNISTPLLAAVLALPRPPQRIVMTLQKEVAQRLAAKHGTSDYGAITIHIQSGYAVRLVRVLPPSVFYPVPEVDSAVVRLDRLAAPLVPEEESAAFHAFVRKGFSQRRKKLSNTLGIADSRRPEELSVPEWVAAWNQYKEITPNP